MNAIIDGLNIEYTEKGEGIPVLLLHGWGSSYDVYGGVISALCDRRGNHRRGKGGARARVY